MQKQLGDANAQYAGTVNEVEFDSRSLDVLKDFGRQVCQDLIDTMDDMIKEKCKELARAVKKGQFDDWCAHASQDIWEMKRVIREASVLHGDMTGCLVNWLEKRENTTHNVEAQGRTVGASIRSAELGIGRTMMALSMAVRAQCDDVVYGVFTAGCKRLLVMYLKIGQSGPLGVERCWLLAIAADSLCHLQRKCDNCGIADKLIAGGSDLLRSAISRR